MSSSTQEVDVSSALFNAASINLEAEATLTGEITVLWNAHRTSVAVAKRTRGELEDLRFDLGFKLREMKSSLVRTGRGGGWAAYLRSIEIPRASAERYVKQYEALFAPARNSLSDTLSAPSEDDVLRLVRNILPKLQKILTTATSVKLFVDQVTQQLQPSVADIDGRL